MRLVLFSNLDESIQVKEVLLNSQIVLEQSVLSLTNCLCGDCVDKGMRMRYNGSLMYELVWMC
ncbi:MAG: hypothetical protein GFH27_549303n285 [Chloroflexi bacterium AL-W]|nr:hypothetical protein [Chloroflexi bacterium AL-N1]NOK68170.1 hypothetical protein [Chloroflexi bacterium AL-N10]NOK73510.1 hypothetical protein [Chloroflexi bacterium AL-N5]NOK83424.1 hypothetical protein [Chloroflexi bacterium AL-W]NOK87841.1 hypothetical protein [Chloroflexi bacterium AL-N15]